jgi:hypothetical protein
MDVPLDDMADYLEKAINKRYQKEKKAGFKFAQDIQSDFSSVENLLKDLGDEVDEEKDDVVNRSLGKFVASMQAEMAKVEFPKDQMVKYTHLRDLHDSLVKIFTAYNENGKKWIPKFSEQFKAQNKSLGTMLARLFRDNTSLDEFCRKKFDKVKNAEDLGDKISRVQELCARVIDGREKIVQYEADSQQYAQSLEELEAQLLDLEKDPLVDEQASIFREQNRVKQEIQLQLSKIKKSTKKLENAIDSGIVRPRFITPKEIKDYLKNPFESLINDGHEYPKLRAILENVGSSIEDDSQAKDDKKAKAQDSIKAIKDDYSLTPLIERYISFVDQHRQLTKQIQEKGTAVLIDQIKQKISDLTTQKSHAEADLEHEKEMTVNTLSKMKSLKEGIEEELKTITGEAISIVLAI